MSLSPSDQVVIRLAERRRELARQKAAAEWRDWRARRRGTIVTCLMLTAPIIASLIVLVLISRG